MNPWPLPSLGKLIRIKCESCGHFNPLERRVHEGETVRIICHSCEMPLSALISRTAPVDRGKVAH